MAVTKIISGGSSHGSLAGCIEYVLQKEKTPEELVFMMGPYDEEIIAPKQVYQAFIDEKKIWGKDNGRMYYHMIVSFHHDENINAAEVLYFGIEYANRLFHDHQTLVVVHQDKAHLHVHLVINSVSFKDGHKFHSSKRDLENMKHETDRMCRERELTVTQKGHTFDNEPKNTNYGRSWNHYENELFRSFSGESYVLDCAYACLMAMDESADRNSFINSMKDRGWETVWADNRKHITFINEEGQKVRDSNISRKFDMDVSKDSLEALFKDREETELSSEKENEMEFETTEQLESEEPDEGTIDDTAMKQNSKRNTGGRDMDLSIKLVSGYKSEEDIKEEEREQEEAQDFDMALALEKAQDVSDDRNLRKEHKETDTLKRVLEEESEQNENKHTHRHRHRHSIGLGL